MRTLILNKFLHRNGGSETYIFKLGEALEQHGHEVQYFGMEHEGRCVGNRVNAYTSDMDFHGGSKLSNTEFNTVILGSDIMEYGNIIEKEQNKFDLIFKVKRKYENTNESTTWVSINERKRVSALYKEQEYNFIPKYSEIYEIGSETFVDDVTVAAEKMAQKIYDYYYM